METVGAPEPANRIPRSTSSVTAHRVVEDAQGIRQEGLPDLLAVEEPLEIRITHGARNERATRSLTVTMRTPGHDPELAAGFLLTEGVLDDAAQILRLSSLSDMAEAPVGSSLPVASSGNVIHVEIEPGVELRTATLERNFYTTSSCGICGKASLLALRSVCPPRRANTLTVEAKVLYALPERLRAAQSVFDATGGLHGAGLFTAAGELVASREDVGRHNAVDKLLGAEFLGDRVPLRDRILMLSGRASFELLQKAVMAGVPMVAAVGAPSSLAVQVAQEFDITLVGFLRERRFNVYHGLERITGIRPDQAAGRDREVGA